MPFLRPRTVCHYCGQRSQSQLTPRDGRKFECKNCLSTNFLDENGDIADIPIDETAPPSGGDGSVKTRNGLNPVVDSIFCSTCQKNQYLYTEALSNYLPDPDNPNYLKCEAALPEFKRRLEQRYPQCCAQCEPRVKDQLRQATYVAKADHVRRMLERSRQRRVASRLGWRSLLVRLGGLGFTASVALQLLWHAMGALSSDLEVPCRPTECLKHLGQGDPVSKECTQHFGHLVGPALALGLLCVWWNPAWQHKLSGNEGRLVGLEKYYKAQFGILLLRFASWGILHGDLNATFREHHRPLHAVSLVFASLLSIWLVFFTVHVDKAPPLNWNQDPAPLISNAQFVPPKTVVGGVVAGPTVTSNNRTFPIASLSSSEQRSQEVWRPQTYPDVNGDMMDWQHTSTAFQPNLKPVRVKPTEPSPFYGTIPAMPTKRTLFGNPQSQPEPKKAIGIPPGHFDRPRITEKEPQMGQDAPIFAPPRMFPPQRTDTGLENIFGTIFSLDERDSEVQDVSMDDAPDAGKSFRLPPTPKMAYQPPSSAWSSMNAFALFAAIGLVLCAVFLFGSQYISYPFHSTKLILTGFGVLVAAVHLFMAPFYSSTARHFGAYLLFSSEFSALTFLGWYKWRYSTVDCERIVAGIMGFMIWQEIFLIFWNDYKSVSIPPAMQSEKQRSAKAQLQPPLQSQPTEPSGHYVSDTPWNNNASEWKTEHALAISRPRSNSIETTETSTSVASTSSTATGWKTPKTTNRRLWSQAPSPGDMGGFGRLALDDRPGVSDITGPRSQAYSGMRKMR